MSVLVHELIQYDHCLVFGWLHQTVFRRRWIKGTRNKLVQVELDDRRVMLLLLFERSS